MAILKRLETSFWENGIPHDPLNCSVPKPVKDNNIKPGEATHLVADPSLLKEILDWEPKILWDKGLQQTIEYYISNKNYDWIW